ncbi:hypothetical protein [Streptomyces sp. NBC_00310]|uniref:hypothetical protein n=1 Tax=Streptomyces sp. NBC_00310 TaxID=2903645 RepID=UPI002E20431B
MRRLAHGRRCRLPVRLPLRRLRVRLWWLALRRLRVGLWWLALRRLRVRLWWLALRRLRVGLWWLARRRGRGRVRRGRGAEALPAARRCPWLRRWRRLLALIRLVHGVRPSAPLV